MRIRNLAAGAAVAILAGMIAAGDANALTIVDYFASSIQNDPNAANIEQAISSTTNSIASLYSNPVTVGILFQEGPGAFLGESSSTFYFWNTADYDAASLAASLAHPNNIPLAEGLAHLSTGAGYPSPSNPAPNLIVTGADLRALGLNAPGGFDVNGNFIGAGPVDTVITLSTSYPLDYDADVPSYNGGDLTYNARDTVAHEVDEALGIGGSGSDLNNVYALQNGGTTGSASTDNFLLNAVGVLDRFRYSAPGVASYSTDPSATAYFSLDGGVTNLATFNQIPNGDFGDLGPTIYSCGSAGGHGGPIGEIQDAFSCYNEPTTTFQSGLPEDTMLQSIGWNPVPEPVTWAMLLLGMAGVGAALRRTRRQDGIAGAAA